MSDRGGNSLASADFTCWGQFTVFHVIGAAKPKMHGYTLTSTLDASLHAAAIAQRGRVGRRVRRVRLAQLQVESQGIQTQKQNI